MTQIIFSLAGNDADVGVDEASAILESARALYQDVANTTAMRLQIGGPGGMVLEVSQAFTVRETCSECDREVQDVVKGKRLCASHASAALQKEDR